MTMWRLLAALCVLGACAAEPRLAQSTLRPRPWQRGPRTLADRKPNSFVGPHVCRSRNSTHCCPGWTSRPNSLLCIVPVCRPDCGSPGACVAPNMCRCAGGVEAPSCGPGGGGLYPYPVRTPGGCRRICMNGGTCTNGTCACAPGWSGEFCTEPICREPCLHGGRCIAPDRCVCFHGLSGTRCEIDRRTGPCYTDTRGALCTGALEGVVCTKQLCCATVGVAWGHPCERCADLDCPQGHLRNLATKECQDIDECAAVPGLCQGGRCINSIGSFSCECPPGQRRHRVTNNCEDIDECEDPDICPNGKCVNTEGDYYCLCNPHFIPSPDKKFCIDGRVGSCFTYLSETGECADRLDMPLSNRDCCCGYNMGRAWGDLCTPCPPRGSSEWSHLCGGGAIPPNWRRNVTGGGDDDTDEPRAIAKINECMLRNGICGLGTCVDKDIGYQCECWDGAESVVQDGNPTCIDIDECALEYCKGGTCINRPGGFDCRCPPGFDPVNNGLRCSDKNECEMTNGGMCTNGVCHNSDGGYQCLCNPGYESTETGHACRDVDECRDNPRVCRRGRCRNTPGSYECECEPGFSTTAGGYCTDIDECADKSVCQGGRCVNSEGSFQCVCEAGYRPTPDRGACVDVNECSEQRVCRNGRCHNTPGSFRCECLPGFSLSNDGRTCLDEVQDLCYEKFEEGHCTGPGQNPVTRSQCCCSSSKGLHLGWGVACKACPEPGSKEYDILCPEGASKDNGGTDINECTMIPGICPHGTCENLEPGYKCICDPGFHPDADGICRDIDECDMHQSYCTGGQCRNTLGSFTCVCPPGTRYEPDEQICRDIDECEEQSNPCDNGRCINSHGSYECECENGFVLDATAQHCLDNRRGSCWRRVVDGQCEAAAMRPLLRQECCCSVGLAWGSPCEPCEVEHCPCPKGFAKLDGATCRDVDECQLDSELCIGGTCVNTDGSYRCDCPPGLTLDPTGNRCVDTRREYCYTEYVGGRCASPLPLEVLRAVCCCSALGRAWGDGRCEPCPKKGTDAYRNLCIADGTGHGPTVWDRPGSNVTGTDIWGGGPGTGEGGETHWGGGTGDNWGNQTGESWHKGGPGVIPGQMEVNECAAFPGLCGHGRCRNLVGTFTCDCFPGYEKDSKNHTCVDVNECEIVDGVCGSGECRNTEGSFTCHCHPGHKSDDFSKVCVDIDECVETRGLCRGGRCINTPGSFRCECGPGMELAPDRLSCKDVDECSITSGICSNGACENLMGTYQCVCDEGYAQSTVKSHCEDIDECTEDPTRCQHECVNTPGSYHCTCREGWHLRADGRTCRDIDECGAGARPCGGGECRNTPGSYTCTCADGLLPAPDGAKPTCQDIDECQDIPDLCGAGECRNTIGSFVCRCPDGYSVKPEQGPACTDDDECELGTCDCHPAADCINLPGSFQCRCRDGWRGDGTECEDIDECLTNNGGCHPRATCTNTDGSFMCLCDTGYKGDGYSCVDIDECANDPTLCENGHCNNIPGGYECDCDVGFTKSPDGKSCLDMDECATFDNVCVFGRCVNTYGMFKCICDKGYQSDSIDDLMPGFNCTDVDECKSPQSCQYGQCINTQGSYICRCPPNYELVSDGTACYDSRKARCYGKDLRSGTEHCRDSDELSEDGTMAACCCSVGAAWGNYCDLCPEPGSEAYRQLCPGGPGYQPVLEPPSYVVTLADIDECTQHPALCEHGTCTNTFGSFVCTCGDGWKLTADEQRCEDIDECAKHDICGPGICRNMQGSYVCLCPEGYVAMPNGKECVDVRQRQCYMEWDESTGQCSGASGVPQTKYLCCCSVGRAWGAPCEACPDKGSQEHMALCGEKPGEYINPMTNETKPINECDIMPQLCKPGTCHDTPTGFQCGCDHGYEHDNTSHLCRDIDECALHRTPCRGLAQCVNLPGAYECRCPPGYRLTASLDECEDVDECADERLCEHGDCRNTIGSYRCDCKPGYTLRDNVCRDVDECARPRPMCRNGTCENLPGSYTCHCDEGFKPGANNDCIDINECREGGMVCRNGRCRNTPGSFRCECAPGYALTADARHCRDVDECSELPHPCGRDGSPSCTNTNGGYECSCGAGWRLVGRRCVDRDECKEIQYVCAGGECRNFNGGYVCDCPPGWRFDKAAAICVDERKELCYDEWELGRCHKARPLQLGRPECCCSEGAAWGRYCERCPAPDSPEFLRICQGGMGRPNLTQDLDECKVRPDVCKGGRCINTDGSFRCQCPPGYILDGTGLACIDADECASDPRICGNGTCTNTPGGYECRCNFGFTQGPEQTCVDIDECAEGRAMCTFRCHNTVGSFRCTCPYGYAVAADGVHCRDIDECEDNKVCPHACENVVGSYICKCPEGYKRTSSPHDAPDACEDIDECAEKPEHCSPGVCINTEGGFMCDCDAGYEPSEDGQNCVDHRTGMCHRSLVSGRCVPEPWPRSIASTPTPPAHVTKAQCCCTLGVAWGPECELCPQPGTPERLELCSPINLGGGGGGGTGMIPGIVTGGDDNGLIGGNINMFDVDECAAMPGLCAPGRCVNTIGSFRCVCGRGYKSAGDVCSDIDECSVRPPPCEQLCKNTEGSYECLCRTGYEVDEDGANCRDVDECERGTHTCQQICTNTEGSYECSCQEGYEKRGDACVDVNECHEEGLCPPPGKCVNLLGSFRCVCPRGFRLDLAGARCLDRDECDDGRCQSPCRNYAGGYRCDCPAGKCVNLLGSFRCVCPRGFRLDLAGARCLDRDECDDGRCQSPCRNYAGGYRCDCPAGKCVNLLGSFRCVCPRGFRLDLAGARCLDRDECDDGRCQSPCRNYAGGYRCDCPAGKCVNLLGSFRCVCPRGFRLDLAGARCLDRDECDDGRCQSPCRNYAGGYRCDCPAGKCVNLLGSFRCVCPRGFRLNLAGARCLDRDECDDGRCQSPCRNYAGGYRCDCPAGKCVNLLGSFRCVCPRGFRLDLAGARCLDRDECDDGRCQSPCRNYAGGYRCDCPAGKCVNLLGSFRCVCPRGFRLDLAGARCLDRDECDDGRCQSPCRNYAGGYRCDCPAGKCVNLLGSFRCVCPRGFRLDLAGARCLDRDECDDGRCQSPCRNYAGGYRCDCPAGKCVNLLGSFRCVCPRGFRLDLAGARCLDRDECDDGRCQSPCRNYAGGYRCDCPAGKCVNLLGSFRCVCPRGFRLDLAGARCLDRDECDDGRCQSPCRNYAGGYRCDCPAGKCVNLLGSFRCVCPRGFRLDLAGARCLDRDECDDGRCQSPCRNYAGGYRCDCPAGSVRSSSGVCVPQDACAASPCGGSPCFAVGSAYRCGCPAGYGWDAPHAVCLQLAGGCATASCLYGCTAFGSSYQCGCPAGYQLVGAGHCLTALDSALPPDDIGDAPVFPVQDQYKIGGDNELISTEGCFSCKVNGRRRRAPDEAVVYANGTTIMRRKKRRNRRRRSILEPEAELIVVSASPKQTWGRAPLLRLVPAEGRARAHYRIAYGDPNNDFVLSKRDGATALRLRRHLKSQAVLERQLELEARFVYPPTERRRSARGIRARRALHDDAPAPLRLYVSVRIAPDAHAR